MSGGWLFEIPVALVGTPTQDGRVLAMPPQGEEASMTRPYPLRVMAGPSLKEPQGYEFHEQQVVGAVTKVRLHRSLPDAGLLVAHGYLDDTPLARHYTGALAVHAARLSVELADLVPGEAGVLTSWRLLGLHVARSTVWGAALPWGKVWQEHG